MIKKLYFLSILTLLLSLGFSMFFNGCTKKQDDLVLAPTLSFHGSGWSTPGNANFHGTFIANNKDYLVKDCKGCHGADLLGGNTQVSCFKCHQGVQQCNLCHGNSQHIYPPKSLLGKLNETDLGVGAHDTHLNSDSTVRSIGSAQVACTECHRKVNSFSDSTHIDTTHLGIASIVFGTLAKTISGGGGIIPNPSFDRTTQKCSNVYCHGYFKNGNLTNQPVFTNPGSVYCGTCHGNPSTGDPRPGGTHPTEILPCWYCHGIVIDSTNKIINRYKHINGVIDFNEQ